MFELIKAKIKLYLYPTLGIIGLLIVGFLCYKSYNLGVSLTESKYIKEIAEINKKSADLLNKQIEDHNKFINNQNDALKSLQEENDRLDKIVKENKDEATKDPNAKRPSLSKSSVMRLNRIR